MPRLFAGLFTRGRSVEEIEEDTRRNMLYDSYCDCFDDDCDDCDDDDYDSDCDDD